MIRLCSEAVARRQTVSPFAFCRSTNAREMADALSLDDEVLWLAKLSICALAMNVVKPGATVSTTRRRISESLNFNLVVSSLRLFRCRANRHQRRIPMPRVLNVLNVTRSAIRLVSRYQHALRFFLHPPVMTVAASRPRRFPVYRIETLVATRTRQLAFAVPQQPSGAHALHMQRMKLFATPRFIRFPRQTLNRNLLERPVGVAQSFPDPLAFRHRITKRSAVGSVNLATVVQLLFSIVVTLGTRRQRRFACPEIGSAMFRM